MHALAGHTADRVDRLLHIVHDNALTGLEGPVRHGKIMRHDGAFQTGVAILAAQEGFAPSQTMPEEVAMEFVIV